MVANVPLLEEDIQNLPELVPVERMVANEEALLPLRHRQGELFLCDIADAVLKDDLASMEHPFYTLSKKPDTNIKRYEHGDKWLEVIPSVKGRATIYDKDLVIYVISQVLAHRKEQIEKLGADGDPDSIEIERRVRIVAKDFLVFTERHTGGRNYELLRDMMDRIAGTRFVTNIDVGENEHVKNFGLFDEATIIRHAKSKRVVGIDVVLSDWVVSIIKNNRVLTLHKDYFRLAKPIERRLYELARKHAGMQGRWPIGVALLWKKAGSSGSLKDFRYKVKKIVEDNPLPDYVVSYLEEKDQVVFTDREAFARWKTGDSCNYLLDADAHASARMAAPGWDVHYLEREWRAYWVRSGSQKLHDPTKAFVGFCRAWFEKRGEPQ